MTARIQTLREYPNLPLLSISQCASVFKAANMGPRYISEWTGFSRVSVHRWLAGSSDKIKKTSHEQLSTLAYRALRALKHKHFPLVRTRTLSDSAFDALRDATYETGLSGYSAEELLPKAWLAPFNLSREQDAAS